MTKQTQANDGTTRRGILITGAGKRIGADLARAMGADGWHVFVHYRSSAKEAEDTVADIDRAGGSATAVQGDLEKPGAPAALIEQCRAPGVRLAGLINNASTFLNDRVESLEEDQWQTNQATNLRAPIFLAKHFAAQVGEDADGVIINMLDNKVFALNPDFFSYTLAKVAMLGATRTLAMALAPRIRVNGIAPGITLISGKQTQEGFERAHDNNPLRHGCTPDQIVGAARFILATPSMTGRVITIDGGQSLENLPRDVAFL